MSAILWPDVVAIAPELSSTSLTAQTYALLYVNSSLNVAVFGGESDPKTRMARLFLAAHLASTFHSGMVAGPLVAESGGGLAEQYQQLASLSSAYSETAYGRQYLGLVKRSAARAWIVV